MATHPRDWNPKGPRAWEAAPVFATLKEVAPNIAFFVSWEEHPNFATAEGLRIYDVDVHAMAIQDGNVVEKTESIGDVHSKPGEHDPDIHGYLPQMLLEAANELSRVTSGVLRTQAKAAKEYMDKVLRMRYDAEQRHHGRG